MEDGETLESRSVFRGRLLDVRFERVRLPDGSVVGRELVRHPGASAVVPLRTRPAGEGGTPRDVLLLRQYRHAADGELWEIPAGTLEPEESPEACARRELAEEAGLEAGELHHLSTVYTTPGFTDERVHLFLAEDARPGPADPEPGEVLEPEWVPLERALEMVREGEIRDAKTGFALLYAARFAGATGR